MTAQFTGHDVKILRQLLKLTNGRAWEPPDLKNPFFDRAIDNGLLKRADGHCGFEAFKHSMIAWTPAGRALCAAYAEEEKVK